MGKRHNRKPILQPIASPSASGRFAPSHDAAMPCDYAGKRVAGINPEFDLMPHVSAPWYRALYAALTVGRPDGSKSIASLRALLMTFAPQHARVEIDGAGNLWIDSRTMPDEHRTAFMAHMDSVHYSARPQSLNYADGILWTTDGDCLGADDGAGIAVLVHLMTSGIPALYLFSRGEECGGIGARYITRNPQWMARIKSVDRIASFDRKGTMSICGAQGCGNCASRSFVDTLSEALNMRHIWDTGTYTDNSEFRGIVPEIVNISVGYERAHGPNEYLDVSYLYALCLAVVTVDWEGLPVVGPAPDPKPTWDDAAYWGRGSMDNAPLFPRGTWDASYSDSAYDGIVPADALPDYDVSTYADDLAQSLFVAIGSPEYDLIVDALETAYEQGKQDATR